MTPHENDAQALRDVHALRDAFAALPVPEATPTLDESDATTQAAVHWMADAFAALAVPEVGVPQPASPARAVGEAPVTRLAAARHTLSATTRPWLRHAAAAAVFATLGLALWWGRGGEQPTRAPTGTPHVAAQADAPTPPATTSDATPVSTPGFREAAPGSAGLVAVTTDHLEVSSGPVRLVLLTTGPFASGPSLDLP